MPETNPMTISQKLRDLATWFEDYEVWRAQYQATVDSGGNPAGGPPPPPPPKGFITEEGE